MSRGGDVYSKVVETFEGGHVTSFVVSHYLPRMFMLIPLSSKREREKLREQRMREREGKGVGRWLDLEVNPLSILLVLRIRRQEKLRQLTEAEEVRQKWRRNGMSKSHCFLCFSKKEQ